MKPARIVSEIMQTVLVLVFKCGNGANNGGDTAALKPLCPATGAMRVVGDDNNGLLDSLSRARCRSVVGPSLFGITAGSTSSSSASFGKTVTTTFESGEERTPKIVKMPPTAAQVVARM